MSTVIRVKTEGNQTIRVSTEGTTALGGSPVGAATGVVIKKGYSPYINEETGTWFEYDHSVGGFVDTGVVAVYEPIIDGVSDEFDISDEKVLSVDHIDGSKIDGFEDHINDTVVHITNEERVLWNKRTFVHEQARVSDVWEVTHDLDKHPSVTVVDSAGTVVVGDVQYVDNSNIILTFNGAFSGTAYLN